jgi:hypothetical protein
MTASAPVRAMTQLEGRTESRIVFVHSDPLQRRRRALVRHHGPLSPQFAYPQF